MARRTVFLHCGWRTASTYLWSRFRALDQTISYYEPLHETLMRLTADGSDPNSSWTSSKRGHPGEQRPFAEFLPLAPNGAVSGFQPSFATQTYFLAPQTDFPPLQAYISLLEDHAGAQGRHAVYGFCRSLGRVAWLRRHFPRAYNIVLTRSPYDHWRSCLSQFTTHGVPYFLAMPLQIAAENGGRISELTNLARRLGIPDARRIRHPGGYAALLHHLSMDTILEVFFEVYSLAYVHALSHADLILSIERFADDEQYRTDIIGTIEEETGLRIEPGKVSLTRYGAEKDDIFGGLDVRRISALRASSGPLERKEDAVALYGRALKADIARARKGPR